MSTMAQLLHHPSGDVSLGGIRFHNYNGTTIRNPLLISLWDISQDERYTLEYIL